MLRQSLESTLLGEDDRIQLVDPSFTLKAFADEQNPFDAMTGAHVVRIESSKQQPILDFKDAAAEHQHTGSSPTGIFAHIPDI
ncbi:unnamed protein product [Alternaria alternata]